MDKKKVLIVVDYQKDFVDGALGFEKAATLDEGIANLIRQYMNNGDLVMFTMDTHHGNYLNTQEGKKLPVPHCILGSSGWELYGKTAEAYHTDYEQGSIYSFEKETFGSDSLLETLANNSDRIESITLVGVVTNMCVISNAVIAKAACPEAEIIIKKDLVASFDETKHNEALSVMESMQMTVE